MQTPFKYYKIFSPFSNNDLKDISFIKILTSLSISTLLFFNNNFILYNLNFKVKNIRLTALLLFLFKI